MWEAIQRYNLLLIFLGVVLGAVWSVIHPASAAPFGYLGYAFLNALKLIVIPLIFTTITTSVTQLGNLRRFGLLGRNTVIYYLATNLLAVTIGIVLVNVMQPGSGTSPFAGEFEAPERGWMDFIDTLLPANIFRALAEDQILPLIWLSLLLGVYLVRTGQRAEGAIDFIGLLNDGILRLVRIIVTFAPLGVMGLVIRQVLKHGGGQEIWASLQAVGWYSITVLSGLAIHAVIILPLILVLVARRPVLRYAGNMGEAVLTAFSTASSAATLPITIRCVELKNKVENRVAGFVLPLGATVNMDGTALYEAVAAMFIAQSYGFDLALWQQAVIFLTANLAAVGAAAIPEAGLVTMVMVLHSVGLPVEGIALILVVDWLLDRFRTSINVWGDSVGAAVINARTPLNTEPR